MNRNKASDRALDHAIHRTWSRMYWAHQISRGLRHSLLVFGVTAAILLPLTDTSQPQPQNTITTTIDSGVTGADQPADQNYYFIDYDSDSNSGGSVQNPINIQTAEPVFEKTRLITMPPITKQWHRARFNNRNDTFWAVPSLDFELILQSDPGGTSCTRDTCNMNFVFSGAGFNLHNVGLNVVAATGARQPEVIATRPGIECHNVRPNHTYYLECLVYRAGPANEASDLCLHIRRSEFLERPGREAVALDIRWDYMRDVVPNYSATNRQNALNAFNASPLEGPDWHKQFCTFRRMVILDD